MGRADSYNFASEYGWNELDYRIADKLLDAQKLDSVYPLDVFQGFGRVQLDKVLVQNGLYFDDESSIAHGEDKFYCFQLADAGTVKVTLAWSDYPAEITAKNAFVNNVDLIVGGEELTAFAGNYKSRRDIRNNVEHVIYPNLKKNQKIIALVRGYNIPHGKQHYSLVVTGPMNPNHREPFSSTGFVDPVCKLEIARDHFSQASLRSDHSQSLKIGPVATGFIFFFAILVGIFLLYICFHFNMCLFAVCLPALDEMADDLFDSKEDDLGARTEDEVAKNAAQLDALQNATTPRGEHENKQGIRSERLGIEGEVRSSDVQRVSISTERPDSPET